MPFFATFSFSSRYDFTLRYTDTPMPLPCCRRYAADTLLADYCYFADDAFASADFAISHCHSAC
jgi:hypothetical protein